MFISLSSGQHSLKALGRQKTRCAVPVVGRVKKHYPYLFQGQVLPQHNTLSHCMRRVAHHFINQLSGKHQQKPTIASKHRRVDTTTADPNRPRQVRGVADRMPRPHAPDRAQSRRDSVFIGEAKDYPVPVIGIEYDGCTHPVFYEGNQVVARHLRLNSQVPVINGQLILNDGNRLPVEIMVLTAV